MVLEDLKPFLKIKILLAILNSMYSFRITSKMSGSLPEEIFELFLKLKKRVMIPVTGFFLAI
jgi:hypothetical protein